LLNQISLFGERKTLVSIMIHISNPSTHFFEELLAHPVSLLDLALHLEFLQHFPDSVVGQPVAGHVQGVLEVAIENARLAVGADLL